jgi:esterase/lipase
MAKRDTIFLHYGPGGNAEIERRLLAEANPEVDFWDQPQLDKRQCTYENLLLGTKKRLRSMSNQGATRIKIWGHSFGCNLALDLAQTESDYIESIRLTSPIALIDKGFYNLARALSKDAKTSPELKNELQQTIEKFDKKARPFGKLSASLSKIQILEESIGQMKNLLKTIWLWLASANP